MEEQKDFTQKSKTKIPALEEMMKAGVHFGHRTSRWHAKMEPYIFTSRNNVHIIDLEKTREKMDEALVFLEKLKKEKKIILFVGTKPSAKDIVKETAQACGMPYISERWIGGLLTNFEVISQRLKHFRDLIQKQETGELKKYTKKERHDFGVEQRRLEQKFGGVRQMTKRPDALFVVDVHKEKGAVKEAAAKEIPVVGICDSNADPSYVDYPIPANDDAISSLKLLLGVVKEALEK